MNTQVSRIYTFPSGSRIDLKKIISIGSLDKDQFYNIVMRVYCDGHSKPIVLTLGNSIGIVPDADKARIKNVYTAFVEAWENYVNSKEDEKK